MARGRMRASEKSKDFKGSMLRLFKSLEKWKALLGFGLLLAGISSILAIISPNILSDITDTITKGISPNVKKIEEINLEITKNLEYNNLKIKIDNILKTSTLQDVDKELLEKTSEDKIFLLPDHILTMIIEEIEIDNIKISAIDQVKYITILMTQTGNKNEIYNDIDKVPDSIMNIINNKIDMNIIYQLTITLGVIYIISTIFNYLQSFSMATVSNRFANKLRHDISLKINKLPLKFFDNHETGDILSRITNDVDTISQNMNHSLASLVSNVTMFIGALIMMFITNWIMAITAIIASIIGFIFMSLILGKSQKYFNQRQIELGNMNSFIEEIYSGHNVVKAYNGTKAAIKDFREINNKLYDSNRKSVFLSGVMHPMMAFIGNLGYVAVCIVGAILVTNNIITFGIIVAFMIYVRLFTNPLSQIAQSMTGLQSTAAASERVFEFMDEIEMSEQSNITKKLNVKSVKGTIEFKNVKFGYSEDKIIIKNFNAKVKAGEKIAIVGPTGAGKTTLVNLLMKFYEINSGDILIDGVSIKELTRENIHELFVMVLQDTWLFEGTIKENIKFNKKNITEEEILKSCKVVGIEHFIKTLPGGLNSGIYENDSISQGQKQLLTIARGMIKEAPFLILDEATSNVDTRTEEVVQKAMDKLTEGKTSFIIAHRLSTIKNADLILVMNEGNIIEQGTHSELMKEKGFYYDLYSAQFKKD